MKGGIEMKTAVVTPGAPEAVGPYSQGVAAGGMIFVSGQLPIDPGTGEFARGGIQAQAEQSIKNIAAVLSAEGCTLENVVKTTVFLTDMLNFTAVNEVYARMFEGNGVFPARSAVEVSALPKGAEIEIEAIAVR